MTRRPLTLLTTVTAILLLLAGCGGPGHARQHATGTTGRTSVTVVLGHRCTPGNLVMQCALPPAPPGLLTAAPSAVAYGTDFAWSCPTPSRQFGASYESGTSKDWTASCISRWRASGKTVVVVWETSATRALAGYLAGRQDAAAAAREAITLGFQPGRPIFFAVDFDEQPGGQAAAVAAYFRGVASIIGLQRTGAYGGYWTVKRLFDAGLIAAGWQAYAWSGGLWDARAHLEQYLNGASVDYDRAINRDYGQTPFAAVPPKPPGPTPSQVRRLVGVRDANLRAYRAHHCTMPVLGPRACRTAAANVVSAQSKLPGRRPVCWGRHAQSSAPVCQIVRPELSILSRARDASERVYNRNNCAGPATFGNGVHTRQCDQLRQRQNYFLNHAHQLFQEWA